MLTERHAQKLFPGYRMTGRQVKWEGGHFTDHELTSMDGSRIRHGVEVKGCIEEAQMLEKTKQLRAALKLPEDLSGGAP